MRFVSSHTISVVALSLSFFCSNSNAPAQAHGTNTEAELSVKKLEAAPGLKVDLFASEPQLANPVAFSIDEKGRFFISETHRYKDSIFDITQKPKWLTNDLTIQTVPEREAFLRKTFGTNVSFLTKDSELIRLVEDRDGDGHAEASTIFADGFNDITAGTAAGILARKGEVYFTCIPDLWKLTEKNGRAAQREKLSTGYGPRISVSGHDLHGLVLGPDGKIYFSCGDRGFYVTNRVGSVFAYPNTGGVLRCNPDGSDLEVFCIGLRNPQELAFDEFGNLFTDDNDTAGPDDSRVLYLVEGADYGWRASYQYMEGYGPWCTESVWKGGIDGLLPYSGVVAHGPAGLAYYPGTGLPAKFKGHFLACDFPKGVKSFAFQPNGASYAVFHVESFLKPLGATDVAFGPDGNVYVSDWGTAYTMPNAGRIYRVSDPVQNSKTTTDIKKLLAENFDGKSNQELKSLLGHANMRVRQEAQFAFVKKGTEAVAHLGDVALHQTNQLARLNAVFGLAQLNHQFGTNAGVAGALPPSECLEKLLTDRDPEIRAQAAKGLGDGSVYNVETLSKLLNDQNPRVRFFAAMSLGKLKSKDASDALVQMARTNADKDQFLVHAAVFALINIGDFDFIHQIARDDDVAVRRVALLCMRRMERTEIAEFLDDSDPALVLEAARAINDIPIPEAFPRVAALLNSSALVDVNYFLKLKETKTSPQDQLVRRAINVNFRLGEGENADALAKFSINEHAPAPLRIEAIDALADWEHPDPRDRVMGLWQPLPSRDKDPADVALRSAISELFQSGNEEILTASVRAMRKLQMNDTTILIIDLFGTPGHSAALRVECLGALVDLQHETLPDVIKTALADSDIEVRREAIKYVEHVNPAEAPALLERLFSTEKDVHINQTIVVTLGNSKEPTADAVIARLMDQLLEGKLASELHLDLLEAASKRKSDDVKKRVKTYEDRLAKDNALAPYRVTLSGGDAENGKKIFHERDDVGCLRCHSIRRQGGTVGPDLGGIGKRQSREYLLESIVFPNKQIATGFESAVVVMKNGASHAGLVKNETDAELLLDSPEDGQVKIKKSEIEKRTRSLSPMPEEISKLLTKREIRDVVEYLSTLK